MSFSAVSFSAVVSCSAAAGVGWSGCGSSRRQRRWASTLRSRCPARLCHRCQRSATCTASGGAEPGGLGVGTGPIPADHLDSRVFPQPAGETRHLPVGQQVHRPPAGHVDHDAALDVAAAQCEVVDPEDRNSRDRHVRKIPEQAQQAVSAGRHAQPVREPSAGASGQRHCDRGQHSSQQRRASCSQCGQHRGLLGKGACRARGVVAEESPYPQPKQYRTAGDRGVDQLAAIPLCTRRDDCPHRGHTDSSTRIRASTTTPAPQSVTASMTSEPRCGRTASRSHSGDLDAVRPQTSDDTPRCRSRKVRQSP